MIEEKQLKDTLNLPSTTLAMRANAANREIEIQKFWEENKIYKKMLEKNKGNKSFILHDGPPYLSSDKIHIGTAMNKILKDIVLKYKTQKGFYTPYIPGYDAHGLPIENAVVKNIKGGRNALTPLELRQKCREFAAKNLKAKGFLFSWYVLGEGPLRKSLEEQAENSGVEGIIKFIGVRSNPYPYIKNADLYVMPSRYEGKSIALDEAKILCKPIVVTNYPTVNDAIEDGHNGCITEISADSIANGIMRVANDNRIECLS